jgi:hypothetical protein
LSGNTPGPLYQRLLWMLAIWLMSVLALGIAASIIRLAIPH